MDRININGEKFDWAGLDTDNHSLYAALERDKQNLMDLICRLEAMQEECIERTRKKLSSEFHCMVELKNVIPLKQWHYLSQLKLHLSCQGYSPETVQAVLKSGFDSGMLRYVRPGRTIERIF